MKKPTDLRLPAVLVTVAMIGALGLAVRFLPDQGVETTSSPNDIAGPPGRIDPISHTRDMRSKEIAHRFQQAIIMLRAKQHEYAVSALHRLLELAPRMPEAHVNMGFAMLGLDRAKAAHDFFYSATELKPAQANAYYGLAVALERLCDLPSARGAMRTYIHLAPSDDPFLPKARSALWEWEVASKQEQPISTAAPGETANRPNCNQTDAS